MNKKDTISKKVEIKNELGIHARPAAMFVKLTSKFKADIFVEKDGESVNGKSIMGIMMLAASKGTQIKIKASGTDAEQAVEQIEELINSKFGEN